MRCVLLLLFRCLSLYFTATNGSADFETTIDPAEQPRTNNLDTDSSDEHTRQLDDGLWTATDILERFTTESVDDITAAPYCAKAEFMLPGIFAVRNVTILYEDQYRERVGEIKCGLSSAGFSHISARSIPSMNGSIEALCNNTKFNETLQHYPKLNILISLLTIRNESEVEKKCKGMGNILFLKRIEKLDKNIAHFITFRTDLVVPWKTDSLMDLDQVLTLLIALCGPPHNAHDVDLYKTFRFGKLTTVQYHLNNTFALARQEYAKKAVTVSSVIFCVSFIIAAVTGTTVVMLRRRHKTERRRETLRSQSALLAECADPNEGPPRKSNWLNTGDDDERTQGEFQETQREETQREYSMLSANDQSTKRDNFTNKENYTSRTPQAASTPASQTSRRKTASAKSKKFSSSERLTPSSE